MNTDNSVVMTEGTRNGGWLEGVKMGKMGTHVMVSKVKIKEKMQHM